MFFLGLLKRIDWGLMAAAGVLFIIGLFVIYSANYSFAAGQQEAALKFIRQQALSLAVAAVFFILIIFVNYDSLKKYATPIYLASLLLLIVVLLAGKTSSGARRWLSFGFFTLQPSELMKISFIIITARLLCFSRHELKSLRMILPFIFYLIIPFFLIAKQPDLGTALTLGGIFLGMLLWAGLNTMTLMLFLTPLIGIALRHHIVILIFYLAGLFYLLKTSHSKIVDRIFFLGLNIIAAFGFDRLWNLLRDYQQKRILSFLNPGLDPFGSGYHALQSRIAVGAGGLWGRGFLHGSQTHYSFIPEQHTDFIFSVVGEEFGFLGSLVVLALFFYIIWRLISIASRCRSSFASFLIIGVASMFTFHLVINIGMAVGIMPVVGVPLPFLSYGGSALLVNFLALGIVQSIIVREEKLVF